MAVVPISSSELLAHQPPVNEALTAASSTNVRSLHPRENGGVLLYEGDFKSRVNSIEWGDPTAYKLGAITTGMAHLTDGTVQEVKVGEPNERTTDIALSTGTALFTRQRGLNKRMMMRAMGLGMPFVSVGTELEFDGLPNIGRSAHNNLAILDVTEEKFGHASGISAEYGISRRAMIGMAIQALAPLRGREIVVSDLIVPCFNQSIFTAGVEELGKFATEPLLGAKRVAKDFRHLPWKHMLLYPKTIDTTRKGVISHLATIPTLVSGDAGRYGRLTNPNTTNMHLQVWEGDGWSQGEKWVSDFSDYPNVQVDLEDGGSHFACALQETLDDWYARTEVLRDELVKTGDDHTKIDIRKIVSTKASTSHPQ